eukprot:25715-Amphidinium_carterae.2
MDGYRSYLRNLPSTRRACVDADAQAFDRIQRSVTHQAESTITAMTRFMRQMDTSNTTVMKYNAR